MDTAEHEAGKKTTASRANSKLHAPHGMREEPSHQSQLIRAKFHVHDYTAWLDSLSLLSVTLCIPHSFTHSSLSHNPLLPHICISGIVTPMQRRCGLPGLGNPEGDLRGNECGSPVPPPSRPVLFPPVLPCPLSTPVPPSLRHSLSQSLPHLILYRLTHHSLHSLYSLYSLYSLRSLSEND